jgi:hypothetical protein
MVATLMIVLGLLCFSSQHAFSNENWCHTGGPYLASVEEVIQFDGSRSSGGEVTLVS